MNELSSLTREQLQHALEGLWGVYSTRRRMLLPALDLEELRRVINVVTEELVSRPITTREHMYVREIERLKKENTRLRKERLGYIQMSEMEHIQQIKEASS